MSTKVSGESRDLTVERTVLDFVPKRQLKYRPAGCLIKDNRDA